MIFRKDFEDGISRIDEEMVDQFIREDEKLKMQGKRKKVRIRIGILVACLAVGVAGLIPLALRITSPNTEATTASSNDVNPSVSEIRITDHDWKLLSDNGQVLEMTMQPESGNRPILYLNADYSQVRADVDLIPDIPDGFENDPGVQLFAEFLCSQLTFDYELHFSLYQREYVDARFTVQAIECGYTYETALARINEVSVKLFPFSSVECFYTLTERKVLEEDRQDAMFRELKKMGIDTSRIGQVLEYRFDQIDILIDDRFWSNSSDFDVIAYQYNNRWYLYGEIEDDLSIDMLGRNVDEYLAGEETRGIVTEIGKGYLIIGDRQAMMFTGELEGIQVGDDVSAVFCGFFSIGATFTKDGMDFIELNGLISIEKTVPPTDE
ncbi:MAG: hypothetical protein ACI3YK_00885 [Eubacteriales bacterium]